METGTLKELGVKPGDVVEGEYVGTGRKYQMTVRGVEDKVVRYVDGGFDRLDGRPTFRIISRASDADDTPKTWGEMTDAEKGALLLAWQRGEVIEWLGGGAWDETCAPVWSDKLCYRVKCTPHVSSVSFGYSAEFGVEDCVDGTSTHRITFDIIDGKPDCTTVKMEAVE